MRIESFCFDLEFLAATGCFRFHLAFRIGVNAGRIESGLPSDFVVAVISTPATSVVAISIAAEVVAARLKLSLQDKFT